MAAAKATAAQWVEERHPDWSAWSRLIFEFGETAWREYRSAAWYVDLLRSEGFSVEEGSGGMPTAFCAVWENGDGPTIGAYAEYDGIPGNCQAADVIQRPRDGLGPYAGGHTDPHSALGIAQLAGLLATKEAMRRHDIRGRLKFFGEPAEKVRGSKPIHAARGYYDDLDAALSFHPFYMLPLCNTVRWNTHCGPAYGAIYRFTCDAPETWLAMPSDTPIPAYHSAPRAPGANDAVVQLYAAGKALKEHILSSGQHWSMNEAVLTMGQATADNLPAGLAEIMYLARVPTIEMAEHVFRALDHFAESAARLTHCGWSRHWVTKGRPGLPNHALARLCYANLEAVGPPRFTGEAITLANRIRDSLGLEAVDRPYLPEIERLTAPEDAEAGLRKILPPVQEHFTSDDYTEYCWHAPTVRLYVGRPALVLRADGGGWPAWAMNALGGLSPCIDPMISVAAKTLAFTALDLLTKPEALAAAKAEFSERTGGVGGKKWVAPLCDYDPPIHFRWPEYVTTPRGHDWVIPSQPWLKQSAGARDRR
jgi:aminobenzoyl-glutamate utilization protein B